MKEIKKIFFNSIEINIQYKNELITIISEPFKTLKSVIIKALKKMISIPKRNIHCYYLGVDISKSKEKKVGDLFPHYGKVTLKLISKENEKNEKCMNSLNLSLLLSHDKTKYSLKKSRNSVEIKTNKIKALINEEKEQKEKKKSKAFDNFTRNIITSISRNLQKNKQLKFLSGDKNQALTSNDSSRILPPLNKSSFLNSTKTEKNKYLCKCKKYKISNYCKICKMLICNNCKNNEKHKNHEMIYLDEYNYIQDIINYGNSVEKEIINNIKIHKTLIEKLDILDMLPFDDLLKEKENIIEKYQKMIDKYNFLIHQIENYLNKNKNEDRIKLEIENYNKILTKTSKEIKDYMDNSKNKNLNINSLEMIFKELSSKEEMIFYFNKDNIKYQLINEINTKIKSFMNLMDKIVEELNNKGNTFNLENKYYEELVNMKIIGPPVKKKEENEGRRSIIIGGHEVKQSALNRRRNNIFSIYLNE